MAASRPTLVEIPPTRCNFTRRPKKDPRARALKTFRRRLVLFSQLTFPESCRVSTPRTREQEKRTTTPLLSLLLEFAGDSSLTRLWMSSSSSQVVARIFDRWVRALYKYLESVFPMLREYLLKRERYFQSRCFLPMNEDDERWQR